MTKVDNSGSTGWIKYMAGIMKEVGLLGFIVLFLAFVFLFWASAEQKREFIDRFILLKHADDYLPCSLIIVFLIMIMVVGSIYCNRMLKLRREENNRIGAEKSDLQKLLLKKDLNSSE